MKIASAVVCLVASPLACLAIGSSTRGQSIEGPISIGGPPAGGFDDS